jgi:hypothetical protein
MTTKGGVVVPPLPRTPKKGVSLLRERPKAPPLETALRGHSPCGRSRLIPCGEQDSSAVKVCSVSLQQAPSGCICPAGKSPPPSMGACFRSRSLQARTVIVRLVVLPGRCNLSLYAFADTDVFIHILGNVGVSVLFCPFAGICSYTVY